MIAKKKNKVLAIIITLSLLLMIYKLIINKGQTCDSENIKILRANLNSHNLSLLDCSTKRLISIYEKSSISKRNEIIKSLFLLLVLPERNPSFTEKLKYIDDIDDYYNEQSEIILEAYNFLEEREESIVVIDSFIKEGISKENKDYLNQLKQTIKIRVEKEQGVPPQKPTD